MVILFSMMHNTFQPLCMLLECFLNCFNVGFIAKLINHCKFLCYCIFSLADFHSKMLIIL